MSTFDLWGVPIITGIASGVLFFILGLALPVYIKRPKLAIGGSGGGGGAIGFQEHFIEIQNVPGRLGLGIGQTIIFGLRVNRQHWFGLPVMREAAKNCTAWLYDDEGTAVSMLHWRDPADHAKRKAAVDIDSGERVGLYLFAQREDDIPNYYPYAPGADGNPVVPAVKFNGTKRFIVRVMYSDGRHKQNFKYTVSNYYQNGQLLVRPKWRR
jgi:hypothetical protein